MTQDLKIDGQPVTSIRYVVVPRWWRLRALWRWIARRPLIRVLVTQEQDSAKNGVWEMHVDGWRRPS